MKYFSLDKKNSGEGLLPPERKTSVLHGICEDFLASTAMASQVFAPRISSQVASRKHDAGNGMRFMESLGQVTQVFYPVPAEPAESATCQD